METLVQTKEETLMCVPIEKIVPDPNQPRQTLEEIQDMANSIKGAGRIIQAIGITPVKNGYRIIYGHRRYAGAKLLGLTEINAIVYKNVTDDDIKAIQLIENIQRQDVHPMQQARVFNTLIQEKRISVEEVSRRIGKSIHFVRQQLTLVELVPKWQDLFLKNGISLVNALKIALLPSAAQMEIYKDTVRKEDEKSDNPQIQISSSKIEKYHGFFVNAAFNIADATLFPDAGACTNCRFNTAKFSLFAEDAINPRCNNISCFRIKSRIHLEKELEKAKDDSNVMFVYRGTNDFELAKKLEKEKIELTKIGCYPGECSQVSIPDVPNERENLEEAKEKKTSIKKAKELYKQDLKEYEKRKELFDKKVAAGIYKRGLVVNDHYGDKAGKFIYVTLNQKESKSKKIDTKKADITPEDIRSEIARIKDWEKRKKVKDEEHIQTAIAKAFKEYDKMDSLPIKPLPCNTVVVNHLVLEMLPWNVKEDVLGKLKIPNLYASKNLDAYVTALTKINSVQITFLLRHIFLEKYIQNLPDSKNGYLLRLIAEQMNCFPIKDIKVAQAEKANKRMNSMKTRIAILEEQEAFLVKQQKAKDTKNNVKKATTASKAKASRKAA